MIDIFITPVSFFWFLVTLKITLFWVYLWQLKEYHIWRFIDHFRTHKGKKVLVGIFPVTRYALWLLFLVSPTRVVATYGLLLAYVAESVAFLLAVAKNNVKKPVPTIKTLSLTSLLSIISFAFWYASLSLNILWYGFVFSLATFSILQPMIVSLVILLVQPFFVVGRSTILKKAKDKMSQHKNVTVIGITGSYGKTSTKEFLTTILSQKFNVVSTPEHKNSEIGIAQTILNNLTSQHEIFIVEMGSYNKGGIKLLCDMVKPSIGMVTGVNQQHLATFRSMENLLSAEGGMELVESLPKNGLIILNGDNTYCLDLYKKIYLLTGEGVRKKLYTLKKDKVDSDIWTEDVVVHQNYISFIAKSKEKEMAHVNVSVLGRQNVQNMLGAILVAKELGMSIEEITKACKNIKQEQAGITLKKGIYGINVIDSSYSSNPDGVAADLDYLNIFKGKKIVVVPCLIELGNKSSEIHRKIGKKIAEVCDLAIITTKDYFEDIKKGAMEYGMKEDNMLLCEKPGEIFSTITTLCKQGDAVLLEGRVPNELIKLLNKKTEQTF